MCVIGGLFAIAMSGSTAVAVAAECPNEAIRTAQGALALELRECRAFEIVSPLGSVPAAGYVNQTSLNGERFAYTSLNPYPGDDSSGLRLLSSRTSEGWSTQPVTPPQGGLRESTQVSCGNASIYFSAELNSGVLADGGREVEENGNLLPKPLVCEGDTPALVEGEPRRVANLFLRDNETSSYELLDREPIGGAVAENAYLVDTTPDQTHVIFSERAPLTQEALGGRAEDLYEWAGNALQLVSVLPNGKATTGTLANGPAAEEGSAPLTNALSATGEQLYFYNYEAEALYARVNAMQPQSAISGEKCTELDKACTVEIDAAEAGAEGASGGGIFLAASADGKRVFFADDRRLTQGATAEPEKPDLYEYDVETGTLVDLTVDHSEPADVIGYTGSGEDGSYLYFVAKAALAGAAVAGKPNLYVRHAGVTTFVASLSEHRDSDWRTIDVEHIFPYRERTGRRLNAGEARVSANGQFLAFTSTASLTGYNNTPEKTGDCSNNEPCAEIFLYAAQANNLTCVSCASSEVRPDGPAELSLPRSPMLSGGPVVASRNVLNDGRVFFDTRTKLSTQATEGTESVYEYSPEGVSLIATGGAEFLDATPTGNDVFFATEQALVAEDTDSAPNVYDARVDGGFVAKSGEGPVKSCETVEECRPFSVESPALSGAASALLMGEGNISPPTNTGGGGGAKGKQTLTRKQKLARALKKCAKMRGKAKQQACRRAARRRFGPSGDKARRAATRVHLHGERRADK